MVIIKLVIKNFLILNCIGKDDKVGLRVNNNFYIHDFDKKIYNNDQLAINILNLIKKYKANINNNFSILVNNGPGSFSSLRASLAVAKGIKITKNIIWYLQHLVIIVLVHKTQLQEITKNKL